MKLAPPAEPEASLDWARAARRALEGADAPTYDVWIVSIRAGRRAAVGARLERLLRSVQGVRGPARLVMVEERAHHPGNLVGTLLTWRAACAQCADAGLDLDGEWRAGRLRVALVHAAGLGRRAAPLAYAEQGDRGSLLLPGRLHGQPARLLEAVLTQVMPLSSSQPVGFLDVIWASQLFFPTIDAGALPPPTAPITKLVTRSSGTPIRDVGTFLLNGDDPVGFVAQDQPQPRIAAGSAGTASDLGSFRLRADALDVLQRVYLAGGIDGHRDLDPHLTAPLLGQTGPTSSEAAQVASLLGTDQVIAVSDLGRDIPWWRLRRPHELRACALALRPSSGHPALQHLLGIDHPISRSWLGDRYVEGPELSWEAVEAGVDIGGVEVVDSVIQDCGLWGWERGGRSPVRRSVVRESTLTHVTGGIDVEDCWLVLSGRPGLRGGGGLAWRVTSEPPVEAGPAPTVNGLCEVRRPRLMDGRAVFHDFLDQDAKAVEHEVRGTTGVSWAKLARLPPHHGPNPGDYEALDGATPHMAPEIPAEAIALLRARIPPGSHLQPLLTHAEEATFALGLHHGCRRAVAIEGRLTPGRRWHEVGPNYLLHVGDESWQRWRWAPQRMAEAVIEAWCTHFLPAGRHGRQAHTQRRLQDFRHDRWTASPDLVAELGRCRRQEDVGGVLALLHGWSLADDPDRTDLATLFAALDDLAPKAGQLDSVPQLRAWARWRLDHVGDDIGSLTSQLGPVAPDLLAAGGMTWSHRWVDGGRDRWVPTLNLRPDGAPAQRLPPKDLAQRLAQRTLALIADGSTPVIGLCGPAASGKSSLAVKIAETLDDAGLTVGYIEADDACWHGPGFRYDQLEHTRDVHIRGPGIVDEVQVARRLRRERARCDAVVIEGCFVGLDPEVFAQLDTLVGVVVDDHARLTAKYARDALQGLRRIDVVTDFAGKTFHENVDGVAPALEKARWVWDRGTGELWER